MAAFTVTMMTRQYGAIGEFQPRSYTVEAKHSAIAIQRAINAAHEGVPPHEVHHVTSVELINHEEQ